MRKLRLLASFERDALRAVTRIARSRIASLISIDRAEPSAVRTDARSSICILSGALALFVSRRLAAEVTA